MNNIKETIEKCLYRNGIDLSSEDNTVDSFSFITAIVDIESELGIEFPDEYLNMESMKNSDTLCEVVSLIMNKVE